MDGRAEREGTEKMGVDHSKSGPLMAENQGLTLAISIHGWNQIT